MSSSGGKFHCQESPPWAASPFGARSTKYHDNPLFKSSPADECVGEVMLHGNEDFKENCADNPNSNNIPGEKVAKVAEWSSLTKTGSKRVLGERNHPSGPEKLDFGGYNFDEPPKSIRALAFPPLEQNDEDQTLSPTSSSTASPSSRFAVPLTPIATVSPTGWSESSDDSVEVEGHSYDPNGNLRTPRPRFLRYRPDWRLEFLNSLELAQGESLVSAFGKVEGEMPSSATEEFTSSDIDNKVADNTFDSEINTTSEDSEESEVLKEEDRSQKLIEDLKRYEAVAEKDECGVQQEQLEEETSTSPRVTWRVATVAFLLGTLFTVVLMTTSPSLLGRLQQVDYLSKWWQTYRESDRHSLTTTPNMMMDEGWEWISDYDITEGYNNQTKDLQPFSTSSPELYELLQAILYGTEDEVENKYMQLMEHEQVELQSYDQLADELHDDSVQVLHSDESTTQVEQGPEQTTPETQAVTVTESVNSPSSITLEEGVALPIINAAKLQQDLNRLKRFLASRLIPMLARTLVAVGTLLGVGTLFSGTYKRFAQPKAVEESTPASPPINYKAVKPKVAEDLVLTPECLKSSPYGSFTAYKRTVMNEGSDNELVKLTPVRRSSRIRSHQQTSPTPVCRRRVL